MMFSTNHKGNDEEIKKIYSSCAKIFVACDKLSCDYELDKKIGKEVLRKLKVNVQC